VFAAVAAIPAVVGEDGELGRQQLRQGGGGHPIVPGASHQDERRSIAHVVVGDLGSILGRHLLDVLHHGHFRLLSRVSLLKTRQAAQIHRTVSRWPPRVAIRLMATTDTTRTGEGILDRSNDAKRAEIIEMLEKAYWMEIETVMSYLANSVNPDGVRAQEIKESLEQDITEELGHAKLFAERIKELYGVVPGSEDFSAEQSYLQPPDHQTDIVSVIRGVIEAETGAIEHYTKIVEATDQIDPVTNDMVIDILHDEQGHRRLFEGFLREYEAEGLA
jgi:bacterioferritin